MTDYPRVPAAFINAISEEGTKAEAIEWLQKQWNESCALRAELESLKADLERCMSNLTTAEAEIDRLNRHAPRLPEMPSMVEVASIIHNARFGPDYPLHLHNSFVTEGASGRAYCIRLARAVLDNFRLSHIEPSVTSTRAPQPGDPASQGAVAQVLLDMDYQLCDSMQLAEIMLKYWDVRWKALSSTDGTYNPAMVEEILRADAAPPEAWIEAKAEIDENWPDSAAFTQADGGA